MATQLVSNQPITCRASRVEMVSLVGPQPPSTIVEVITDTTPPPPLPQRVRMSSGERPIGAAKGKQSDAEALCQPPPPPLPVFRSRTTP